MQQFRELKNFIMQYIKIKDVEDAEPIEIPSEDDGTLTVSALAAHYPGATGLKYHLDGHTRAVKLANGKLYPPEDGWGDNVYFCIFPKGKIFIFYIFNLKPHALTYLFVKDNLEFQIFIF